jgi:hypothetical protein
VELSRWFFSLFRSTAGFDWGLFSPVVVLVQLFELMKKREETHQQEIAAKKLEFQKSLAEIELVRHLSSHHCWPHCWSLICWL